MSSDINSFNEKNPEKLPKAVLDGKLRIGNIEIDCAILEDGRQVISRSSMLKLMGRSNSGGRPNKEIMKLKNEGVHIPIFVASNNLIPFIPKDLSARSTPIIFIPLHGGRAHGYQASLIPDICDTYLNARKSGKILTKVQIPIAATLEIITQGLARVGLTALINEACGIANNEKDYLQKILNEYVEKLILPYAKRFPSSFFNSYKKLYGLDKDKPIPMHIGHFINNYIYKELAPGVLEELKKLNPINEKGRREHAHHQFLTINKGVVALEKQLVKISTIMSMSENKKNFVEMYEKISKEKYE